MYHADPGALSSAGDSPATQDVAVLNVDVANHTELLRQYGAPAARAIERYQIVVEESLRRYAASQAEWAGDGCAAIFLGARRGEQAVLTGIHILQELELLNLDGSLSDLGEPLMIRLAAIAGKIQYREPVGKVVGLVLSDSHKLQKQARVQELVIGETVHEILPERIQDAFELIDRNFKGQKVFVFRGQLRDRQPNTVKISALLGRVETGVSNINSACDAPLHSTVDAKQLSELHAEVHRCYEEIASFRRLCAVIDSNWAPTYLRILLDATLRFQRMEAAIWSRVQSWRQRVTFTAEAQRSYNLGFSSLAHGHGNEEMEIGELRLRLARVLGEEVEREARDTSGGQSQGLASHLERLSSVDEMERMAEFVALGRYDRNHICDFVRTCQYEELGRRLVQTLWSIGDLVVGEETGGGGKPGLAASGLFGLLLTDREQGQKFQVLDYFLGDRFPEAEILSKRFSRAGIDPTQSDLDVVWRAIVIGHPRSDIRYQAAERARLSALWQAVAYHGISLLSLAIVAKRLQARESVDLKKIFFDCVRSRLEQKISAGDLGDLSIIADMLEGFYESELFVENPYFKAIEALLALFEARAARLPGQVRSLEARLGEKVGRVRAAPKKEGRIPNGVGDLPPAVQRHLAREGYYIEEFVFHEDYRIAVEVDRYLDGDVLARVARVLVESGGAAAEQRRINPKLYETMSAEKRQALLQEVEKYKGRGASGSELLRREAERKGVFSA